MPHQKIDEMFGSHPWTFAKTMPQNPHFWSLLKQWNRDEFFFAVTYIREHGEPFKFGNRIYTILVIDGWRYWTMDADIEKTTLINRAVHEGEPQ